MESWGWGRVVGVGGGVVGERGRGVGVGGEVVGRVKVRMVLGEV